MKKTRFIILLIIAFCLLIRIFQIDRLPGEWYGDISNVHEYVSQILRGEWPFYFFQSPGPFYHYLIAPIVYFSPTHGYLTYKIASIIVSCIGLYTSYLMFSVLSSKKIAIIGVMITGFSLWYLIWSRLGNSQIVIPLISSFFGYYLVRIIQKDKIIDYFMGAVVSSIGWYVYPQTFIFPGILICFILLFVWTGRYNYKQLITKTVILLLTLSILIIPFIFILNKQPDNFGNGYVGQKILPVFKMPKDRIIEKLFLNFEKTILMYHVRGDGIFRMNVSGHPQLDRLSGFFMLMGLWYFWKFKEKKWFLFMMLMLLILPLPSMSPAIPDGEIPNSARTIAVIPFVYLLVSAGFFMFYKTLVEKDVFNLPLFYKRAFTVSVFTAMVYANMVLYFQNYSQGLPDKNSAPGRIIADFLDDRTDPNVSVYFSTCCWGEYGEPEPKGVAYNLEKNRYIIFDRLINNCQDIKRYPAMVIAAPGNNRFLTNFINCGKNIRYIPIYSREGRLIANTIVIR